MGIRSDGFSFCWDFVLLGFRSVGLSFWRVFVLMGLIHPTHRQPFIRRKALNDDDDEAVSQEGSWPGAVVLGGSCQWGGQMSGIREFHLWAGLDNIHTFVLVAQLTRRVTLHAERVTQFVVVRLVSFVFYFMFIMSLNNHLDPFYRDRFYRLPA